MISYDEIKAKAEEFGIHTSDVQRDYVFGWLIAAVAAHPNLGAALVLKGGNAFRKGYFPSTRFSDDLDFSTPSAVSDHDLVGQFNDVCRHAGETSGVEFDLNRNRLVATQQLDRERTIPSGVVVSSGAGLYGGNVTKETVRQEGGIAMRRRIRPLRARETLIIPITNESRDTIDAWEALLDAETRWLPWVLEKYGLPDLGQVFPPI